MREIENYLFKQKILDNLDNLDENPRKDFLKIVSTFDKPYILGGFIRDSLLQVLYDYRFPLNDLDILVNDDYFRIKSRNFLEKNKSRFGGLKFKYAESEFEIDLFSIDNVFFLNKNSGIEKNIENVLKGVDISTSAFAYDIQQNKIYEHNAMRDIENKEVNLFPDNQIVGPMISRLILHADKMGFKIGKSGVDYIRQNYSLDFDKDILNFLEYKFKNKQKISRLYSLIKNELDSMLKLC
jgi:hypothetical protein